MNWRKFPVWARIFAGACAAVFLLAGSVEAAQMMMREGGTGKGPVMGPGNDRFPSRTPRMCPPGTTGIPPRCVPLHKSTTPRMCPPGYIGLPPKCRKLSDGGNRKCPHGYRGTPPECVKIGTHTPKHCPPGFRGTPPRCYQIGHFPPSRDDGPSVVVSPVLPDEPAPQPPSGNAALPPDTPGITPAPSGPLPPLATPNIEVPRFRPNELVVMVRAPQPDNVAATLAQSFNVNLQETVTLGLLPNVRVYRFRIPDNRSVEGLAVAMSATPDVVASPNFYHQLQGEEATVQPQAAPVTPSQQELPPQYALPKLNVPDAQTLATGKGVTIAVIDSGVDAKHPVFSQADLQLLDMVEDGKTQPDKHGTAIAGLIAGRGNVRGVAPDAKILAIRAFAPESENMPPVTTSLRLARAVDTAFQKGARVFNMSFAGPRDQLLIEMIDAAYAKGATFVAAVGNNGPGAPPAFPAAYEKVIAITATDEADKLYAKANRGRYVTAAAPGVDVLVPVTGNGFDYQTGTSFATAYVTGIIALLKERNPQLTPEDARRIITATARALTKKEATEQNEDYGAGLADAFASLQQVQTK